MVLLIWAEWDINKILSQEIPGDNSYQIDKIYEHVALPIAIGRVFYPRHRRGRIAIFMSSLLGAGRNIIKFGIYR